MTDKYFGQKVDDAIVQYQTAEDVKLKHKVYTHEILPAFTKLSTYYYYTMPVERNPDIMHDCTSFLYEQLNKFDATKKRGFPYFNVIAKHYFIQKLKNKNKAAAMNENVFSLSDNQIEKVDIKPIDYEDVESTMERNQFIDYLKGCLPKWKEQATKDTERAFYDAIIAIFENVDNIEFFNQKALFFYIKEISSLNNKQVSSYLSKMKKKFAKIKAKYKKGDL